MRAPHAASLPPSRELVVLPCGADGGGRPRLWVGRNEESPAGLGEATSALEGSSETEILQGGRFVALSWLWIG